MNITITNRIGKYPSAKEYLTKNRTSFPEFTITKDKEYNGIVIEIDDDDADDCEEALEASGYLYAMDLDDLQDAKDAPKSNVPRWPKNKPIFQKSKAKLPRATAKLPRWKLFK